MNFKAQVAIALLAIGLIGFGVFYIGAPETWLRIKAGNGTVWADTGLAPRKLATLPAGTFVPAVRCIDAKSFWYVEIRLPDRRTGYVLYDPVNLIDKPSSFPRRLPIYRGC